MKRILTLLLLGAVLAAAKKKPSNQPPASALDRYVEEARARSAAAPSPTPGAIWLAGSRLADAARDARASQVDDVLTVVVAEAASAVSTGTTKTQRSSSASNSISALAGVTRAAGPWANLAGLKGDRQLSGQGTTSRTTTLNTTVTARVKYVLPNGGLLVEASKDIEVNGERQTITVRGVARPEDIDPTNSIQSNRLADLEVHVNGKGVVGDAIRRPFFLYRLLLGLLPF